MSGARPGGDSDFAVEKSEGDELSRVVVDGCVRRDGRCI